VRESGCLEHQDKNRITGEEDFKKNKLNHPNSSDDLLKIIHLLEADTSRFLGHIKTHVYIKKGMRLLDVGTGYGYFPHLTQQECNIESYGLDLNYNKLLYGKNTLDLKFNFIFDKVENEEFIKSNENNFDITTAWHVLEHVYDPLLWFNNLKRVTKQNGYILLEFPNENDELLAIEEYSHLVHFQDHVNYFTPDTFVDFLSRVGIKKSNLSLFGIQRYGFYNYIDWIRYGTKQKVKSDDYRNINTPPRSECEKFWLNKRESSLTSDSLLAVIKNDK
tara:strand:- start:2639 stop:3466 length:828 start_codon:yes stop_codon:yes gene_type:complete